MSISFRKHLALLCLLVVVWTLLTAAPSGSLAVLIISPLILITVLAVVASIAFPDSPAKLRDPFLPAVSSRPPPASI